MVWFIVGLQQKQLENEYAFTFLASRLEELDRMETIERNIELVTAVLAGNMFDWGAREVVDLMETGKFGFKQAREKVPGKLLKAVFSVAK